MIWSKGTVTGLDLGIEDLERQVGGGQGAGNGDLDVRQIVWRQRLAGDDHGAVALAHAAAAAHQRVVLLQVGVGVEADGGHVEEGLVQGAAVEGLDVAQGVGKAVAGDAHLVGGQAIEHEGVVGVGAMGDGDIDQGGWIGDCGFWSIHDEPRSFRVADCGDSWMRLGPLAAQAMESSGKSAGRDDLESVAGQEGEHAERDGHTGRGMREDAQPEGAAEEDGEVSGTSA